MLHYKFYGQFANFGIQYCLARIISLKTGLAYNPPRHFLTKHGQPVTWSGEPLFRMAPGDGKTVVTTGTPYIIDALQWVDLHAIPHDRPVIVRQFFAQRYELLQPYKHMIREEWLRIPPERFLPVDPDCLVVHVRRGDYLDIEPGVPANPERQGTATTIDEYLTCLERFPDAKSVQFVTDDAADPFIGQLGEVMGLPWTCQQMPWDYDFLLLASARNLAISQSTFSWLAAFLGHAERIVCSVRPGTFWGRGLGVYGPYTGPGAEQGYDYPNLFVSDEPGRWEWVTK